MWTKSACVVLAWSILLIILVAAAMSTSAHPAQANIRIARSTQITPASTVTAPARPAARYVVQPGDTLSGIAARFAVRGGWPTLYAANRSLIGPDPDVIRPGAVLVLPARKAPARYTVVAGDTLSGIAAALAVRGGWPALYAANQRVIGPDPNVLRPGTVLTVLRPARTPRSAWAPGRRFLPVPPPAAVRPHRPQPAPPGTAARTGMPRWLKTVLLAAGLVIGAAFLAEPVVLLIRRRRQAARPQTARTRTAGPCPAGSGQASGSDPPAAEHGHIVLADHDRLVVTHNTRDDTVYVLRPPGEDPKAILRAARLVLPEDPYRELAERLGMPPSWPIVLADHDRLVVTHNARDGTVYVLRPPGEDPRTILRAARLVLPEDPYEELAEQLGVPAGLPME